MKRSPDFADTYPDDLNIITHYCNMVRESPLT